MRTNTESRRLILVLLAALAILACASTRSFSVSNYGKLDLDSAPLYFVVVNTSSQKIDYDYLYLALTPGVVFDYDHYTRGQALGDAKPDVPVEVIKYLKERGKRVDVGTVDRAPADAAIIFTYEEVWGWDMGDIIKRLTISARPSNSVNIASVSFAEMTMYNSHPVASSLVPQMMDKLFATSSQAPTAATH